MWGGYNNWEDDHEDLLEKIGLGDAIRNIEDELAKIEEKLQEAREKASSFTILDYESRKAEFDEIENTVASLETRKKELKIELKDKQEKLADLENN